MTQKDCIFCKIVAGEVPTEMVFDGDQVVAFNDNTPSADTHILIVPKKHVGTFLDLDTKSKLVNEMISTAQKLVKEKGIEKKYKLVINGGSNQIVPHLHLHVLGGRMKNHKII